jgi:penicillin-binding protein 1A
MLLGGLKQGVTPLEMAFAFSTIANRGRRVSGSLASSHLGPVAIEKVTDSSGKTIDTDKVKDERVYSTGVGEEMRAMLHGVVVAGTGRNSAVSEWSAGKTGTTENFGDAWFVGFTDRYTIAVWVGYADKVRSMTTEYHGSSVQGGTFPAEIWHDLMTAIIAIEQARHPNRPPPNTGPSIPAVPTGPAPAPTTPSPTPDQTQQQPQQQQTPPQQQQPAPTPPAGGGGGGGQGGGGGAPPGAATGQ